MRAGSGLGLKEAAGALREARPTKACPYPLGPNMKSYSHPVFILPKRPVPPERSVSKGTWLGFRRTGSASWHERALLTAGAVGRGLGKDDPTWGSFQPAPPALPAASTPRQDCRAHSASAGTCCALLSSGVSRSTPCADRPWTAFTKSVPRPPEAANWDGRALSKEARPQRPRARPTGTCLWVPPTPSSSARDFLKLPA